MKNFILCLSTFVFFLSCNKQQKNIFPEDREYGIINHSGNTVIPFSYDKIEAFSSGLFIAYRDSICILIDVKGNILTPLKYEKIQPVLRWSFLLPGISHENEDDVIRAEEQYYYLSDRLMVFQNGKTGIINTKGKEIISCHYDRMFEGPEGKYIVINNNKAGICSEKGNIIVPLEFDNIVFYNKEYYLANKKSDYYLIDIQGNIENIPLPFDIEFLSPDFHPPGTYLLAKYKNGFYGLLDPDRELVIPFEYTWLKLQNGIIIARREDKTGIIDFKNNIIVPFKYETLYSVNNTNIWNLVWEETSYFGVRNDEKSGIIDHTGHIIVPIQYDFVSATYGKEDTYFNVWQNAKKGIVNEGGTLTIPCVYKTLLYQEPGLFIASSGENYGVIDKYGKTRLPFDYEFIDCIKDNYIILQKGNKWGVIEMDEQSIVLPFEYNEICFHSQDEDLLIVKKEENIGVINMQGKIIIPCIYTDIEACFYDPELFIVKR